MVSGLRGGRWEVWPHPQASSGHTGAGPGKGLIPGDDQNYFGRGPGECSPGGEFLSGDGHPSGDGTPLPWGLYRR